MTITMEALNWAHRITDGSPDPNTRVGAVIITPKMEAVSGCNDFPKGIAKSFNRLKDRDTKLKLMVHAEMNAVLMAAKLGIPTDGAILYLSATDNSGLIWGGPPCTRCTVEIIQAGIKRVVSRPGKPRDVGWKWREDVEMAGKLLEEAGIEYEEIPL